MKILPHETHLWYTSISPIGEIEPYQAVLAEDELRRAARFYFAKDRSRYILCRGILRYLLAYYLNLKPDLIQFEYNIYGKPALLVSQNWLDLQFNISHSEQMLCCAFTIDRAVGVDIEYHRDNLAYLELIKRYFTQAELVQFMQVPESEQKALFYRLWTCKEAVIKAVGKGLFLALDKFSVDMTSLAITSTEPALKNLTCILAHLPQLQDYTVALAADNLTTALSILHWDHSDNIHHSL